MGGIISAFRKLTVEPVAFLFVLNIYCEYSVVQDMISTRLCMNYSNNSMDTSCDKSLLDKESLEMVSKDQAIAMKYYMGIFSFCAILASFFTGSWSDRFGRKPSMMLPSILGIPGELLFVASSLLLKYDSSIYLVYLGSIFHGISGGSTTVVSSCFGYISDITTTKERTRRVIILEAFFFVGGFFGYQLAGLLMGRILGKKYEYVFAFCAIVHILIVFYVWTLKETRGPKSQLDIVHPPSDAIHGIFNIKHVKDMFYTIFKRRPTRFRIIILCLCSMASFVAMSVQVTLVFTFVRAAPISWTSSEYSYYSGFNYLAGGMSLIVIHPLVQHVWPSVPDGFIAGWGLLSKAVGLVNLGLSKTSGQVWVGVLLLAFSEYTMPSIRSMMSKNIEEDERGKAFSFLALFQNVMQFAGSLIFPSIYAMSISWFPGLAFEVAALIQLLAILLIAIV